MPKTEPKQRFSKAALLEYVVSRRVALQHQWDFDPADGTEQLRHSLMGEKPTGAYHLGRAVAYGEYDGLATLMDAFEIW